METLIIILVLEAFILIFILLGFFLFTVLKYYYKENKSVIDLKGNYIWDLFIKNYNDFTYEKTIITNSESSYAYSHIWTFKGRYIIYVYVEENEKALSYVYTCTEDRISNELVLSPLNEEKSNELAELLIDKISRNKIKLKIIK